MIDLARIDEAHKYIAQQIRPTALEYSPVLSQTTGHVIKLKCEHLQNTGSCKFRGALHSIMRLDPEQRTRGVVSGSTGNHARAVARAAMLHKIPCTIILSENEPEFKRQAVYSEGADIRIVGKSFEETQTAAENIAQTRKMTRILPFDHPDIICGQGTLAREILNVDPSITSIVVPLSGGGLISGIAVAAKSLRPDIKIIGVSMHHGAAMFESQRAGRPIQIEEKPTLADSSIGGIGTNNQFTFDIVHSLVDHLYLVSEADIKSAIHHSYLHEKQIIEGSGAVGIAAILSGHFVPSGPTAVLLSEGNIDMKQHQHIVGQNTAYSTPAKTVPA